MTFKAIRTKLYPTSTQEKTLVFWESMCRRLWNDCNRQYISAARTTRFIGKPKAEEAKKALYPTRKFRYPSWQNQFVELTALRACDPAVQSVPVNIARSAIKNLAEAWDRCWNSGFGAPKFKRRDEPIGFGVYDNPKVKNGRIVLPNIGAVKTRGLRGFDNGTAKKLSIVREADGWYASIVIDVPAREDRPPPGTSVGIDRGVAVALADSSGVTIENPRFREQEDKRIARLQRGIARQQDAQTKIRIADAQRRKNGEEVPLYESKRLQKRMKRKALLEAKVARRRDAWQHKITTEYARNHETVFVEKLETQKMTKTAKGTAEAPGQNVKQKAGLNKAILDVGWYGIESKLRYKLEERAGHLVEVDPRGTSMRCSSCGYISRLNRLSQSEFKCGKCGHSENADVNGAKNIRDLGLGLWKFSKKDAQKIDWGDDDLPC